MPLSLHKEKKDKLDKILSKTGDLNFRRRILTMLEYLDIKDSDHILDMGCGEGFYTMIFSELYECKVTAADYDDHILDMARKWIKESNRVKIVKADICNLDFPDNTFNKIVCTEVLEHIDDDEKAVQELYRVLKPGGVLAATVPNKNYPFVWDPLNKVREGLGLGHFDPKNGLWGGIWAYDHKRLYLPEDFRLLFESHKFKVEEIKVLTHYGVPFNHLVLYIGKQAYTTLPVPDSVKLSMEKFSWNEEPKQNKKTIVGNLIDIAFKFFKFVDSFNDREFSLDTSTMAVAAKVKKPYFDAT